MENEELLEQADDYSEFEAQKNLPEFVHKVVSMDDYFIKHYKSFVVQELNKRLVDGAINQITGKTIHSERILGNECCFRRLSYWRLNNSDFLIDIELRLELQVDTPAGVDTDFFIFYVTLWFSFAGGEEVCEFESMGLFENMSNHDGAWKLDKYLVPVLRKDEIEKHAEEVWEERYPEAAKDAKLRTPWKLAEKLQLSIITLPLYNQWNTKSILFFHESSVLVQDARIPGQKVEPPPHPEEVPANTIVLNTNNGFGLKFELDIYHECIHYEWHYLFYRLQNMQNSNTDEIPIVRRSSLKRKDVSDPVEFMEVHARKGSYALMMPKTFMLKTIDGLYKEACEAKRNDGYYDHEGRRLEYIGRKIANEYHLSKSHVRTRMIQLDFAAAIGALNYVDDKYIAPFAFFDSESCSGNQTYVIDHKHVLHLYENDKRFQQIMQTGDFAYVDGHVVYCESDNVIYTDEGARLTGWANAHIDRVSLRFSKTYDKNHQYTYTFGRLNSMEAAENAFKFLDLSGRMTIKDKQLAADRLVEEMPLSFHGALAYIMKGRCTVDELINRIPISRSTLLRLRTEERKQYNLDQIVAICIGLHLPPWLSDILLERAHLSVKRYGPLSYYGIILDCFYMDTINDVQYFLESNKYDPLDLNFDAV